MWKPFSFLVTIVEIAIVQRFSVYALMISAYMNNSKMVTTIPLWRLIMNDIVSNFLLYRWLLIVHSYGILNHYFASCVVYGLLTIMAFHNQHTFNTPFVERDGKWTYKESAIHGSSIIVVPWYLEYFTSNIQYHHLHHLNSKIPSYHLRNYHNDVMIQSDEFDNVVILTIKQCFENLKLVLYSEKQRKYLTFPEAEKEILDDKVILADKEILLKPANLLKKMTVM